MYCFRGDSIEGVKVRVVYLYNSFLGISIIGDFFVVFEIFFGDFLFFDIVVCGCIGFIYNERIRKGFLW